MESLLRKRLQLRHEKLLNLLGEGNQMIQRGGVAEEEVIKLKLALKTNVEALEKDMFYLFEKFPSADVPESTTYSEDQIRAEDMLVLLETSLLTESKNRQPQPAPTTKLPKLDIPKFTGDILKWNEFWDRFESNIDRRNLGEAEKMSYLLSYLEGTALQTVQGLETTNANYSIAVDLLKKRFGSKAIVVDAHFNALSKVQRSTNNAADCRNTLNAIERHLRVLGNLGEDIEGSHLRVLVSGKFPEQVMYQVRLISSDEITTKELRSALEKVVTAMERAVIPGLETEVLPSTSTQSLIATDTKVSNNKIRQKKNVDKGCLKRKFERKDTAKPTKETKRHKPSCVFCNQDHYSDLCKTYKTIAERMKKLGKRCFKCFKEGHWSRKCNGYPCVYCKKNHNRALCPKKTESGAAATITKGNCNKFVEFSDVQSKCLSTNVKFYLQTATATAQANNKAVQCRVLLDSGSQRSYITKRLASDLHLVPDSEDQLTIFTFGSDCPKNTVSPSAEICLRTKRGCEKVMRVNIVPHITDRVPIIKPLDFDTVDITADDDSLGQRVDILIGNDYYFSFIRQEHVKLQEDLFLINTDFGWLLTGNQKTNEGENTLSVITYCQCHEPGCSYFTEPDLPLRNVDMKFLWALESIGITDSPKVTKDEEVVKHFNQSVKYENGRYQVKWPWISYPPDLPTNYGLAYGRLKSLLRRSDQSVIAEYEDIINDQLKKGIIEIVDKEGTGDGPVHYLPHHMIKQEGKRGRIVYDASAKVKDLKSLNECLYSGPSMLEDMTALLLNFRTGKIGIIADVEKAFLQVGLQETDRDVTRFLWVKDPSQEPTEDNLVYLRFCRVPFGIISSPFLLTATIRYHLSLTEEPLLKEIANKCYVDNLVTTAKSTQGAIELYNKTRKVFNELGMNIRDWTSNSEQFLRCLPTKELAKHQTTQKVLGMDWNPKDDTLKLKTSEKSFQTKEAETKRDVLRTVARLYDPCGFAAPLIIPAKLLFQELCVNKLKWDSPLRAKRVVGQDC